MGLLAVALAAQLAAGVAAASGSDQPLFRATDQKRFDDVEHWKRVFDDSKRDEWQQPRYVVEKLGLRPGTSVADLVAGTGYFVKHLAEAVAPGGTVYAVDIEPAMVAHLRDRADSERTDNVTPLLASASNPRLPASALDVILIVDTFHHLDGRLDYLQRLRGALRPGGRIAIIDWKKESLPVGPPVDHKVAREQVIVEMEAAGYRLSDESTELSYQYFLIFSTGEP
jgi:ubiquinone/menaquinone biosynthesis C-methylase UbiE